jgi:hypothetical protein
MEYFQKGEYPVAQVFFVELDSVLGGLFTSTLLKPKYGKIDIIHDLRENAKETDIELLLKTTCSVVSTCWSSKRLIKAIPEYALARGWKVEDIRVYELGTRVVTDHVKPIDVVKPFKGKKNR